MKSIQQIIKNQSLFARALALPKIAKTEGAFGFTELFGKPGVRVERHSSGYVRIFIPITGDELNNGESMNRDFVRHSGGFRRALAAYSRISAAIP